MSDAGVPVFDGVGDEFADSVSTSVFYGRTVWTLTLPEMLARCEFSTVRKSGFFVIDGARLSLSHHLADEAGDVESAMLAAIEAHYDGLSATKERMRFVAVDKNSTSSEWIVYAGDAGFRFSPEIATVDASALSVFARAVLASFDGALPSLTFQSVVTAIQNAMPTVEPLTHWVILASQARGEALLWCMNLETAAVPDFTARVIGDAVLDAAFSYRAALDVS